MISSFLKKYKDILLYLFFGVLTTLVNTIAYWVFAHLLNTDTVIGTGFAWFIAVLFAYLTNRKWVFHSEAVTKQEIITEMISFFSARLFTGFVDLLIMKIFVDYLGFNDIVVKFASNILVIVLNYIASKLIIFKKK